MVCEYSTQQEGVVQEELALVNRSRRDSSVRVRLQARVMGEIHTPTGDRSLVIHNKAFMSVSFLDQYSCLGSVQLFQSSFTEILSWDGRKFFFFFL